MLTDDRKLGVRCRSCGKFNCVGYTTRYPEKLSIKCSRCGFLDAYYADDIDNVVAERGAPGYVSSY